MGRCYHTDRHFPYSPLRIIVATMAALLLACATPALAHKSSDAYLHLRVDGQRVEGRLELASRDLDAALELDRNGDGTITWGELRTRTADIHALIDAAVSLRRGEARCVLSAGGLQVDSHSDGSYAVVPLHATCASSNAPLTLDYRMFDRVDAQHRALVGAQVDGTDYTAIAGGEHPELMLGETRARSFMRFVVEGIEHILSGFDHVLFLTALLLPAVLVRRNGAWTPVENWRQATWQTLGLVTAFTLAHSVTLAAAAFGWANVPSRLVESAIALTVLLTVVDNVVAFLPRRRWVVALGFGLVHGFGFASVLSELTRSRSDLAMAVFGFNAGVEIGQLIVVASILPLAYVLRRRSLYRSWLLPGASAAIAALATVWLLERSLDMQLLPTVAVPIMLRT